MNCGEEAGHNNAQNNYIYLTGYTFNNQNKFEEDILLLKSIHQILNTND